MSELLGGMGKRVTRIYQLCEFLGLVVVCPRERAAPSYA